MTTHPYGFRIVGATTETRRLINWAAAFSACVACDPRAQLDRESYLSAFTFDDAIRERADTFGRLDVRGFAGSCGAAWLWFDIDRAEHLDHATHDARRLVAFVLDRYGLDDNVPLMFFSGSKGFHVGLPTWLIQPEPAGNFHVIARRFAETLAAAAGVAIDTGVYDKVRAFRAPNSRHPKTGRHKRPLGLDELMHLATDRIVELAQEPAAIELPEPRGVCAIAQADWQQATRAVEQHAAAQLERRAATAGQATLNRGTLAFIRDGAPEGERHRRLFAAAANLAEFDCPPALAHALLTEAGRDSGLTPSDVRRQIDCGLQHAKGAP